MKKNNIIITLSAVLLVFFIFVYLYKNILKVDNQNIYNSYKEDKLDISYVSKDKGYSNVLSIVNGFGISDDSGSMLEAFRFNVENNTDKNMKYKISIVDDDVIIKEKDLKNRLIDRKYIKYKLNNNEASVLKDVVYQGELSAYSSHIHEIRVWLSTEYKGSNEEFHGKLKIEELGE